MSESTTTTAVATAPPAKPAAAGPNGTNRLTGCWMSQTLEGLTRMAFNDPDTGRRFELEAVPHDDGKLPETWTVYGLSAGTTEVPVPVTQVRVKTALGSGERFLAFVDNKTDERYVMFHHSKKMHAKKPDWSACKDLRHKARLERFRPPARRPQAQPAPAPQGDGEPAKNEDGSVPF